MLSKNQINEMLVMQAATNTLIDADWRTKDHDYLLAAMVEAVEAIEHNGWKWWKKQECDLPQLQMELVDIWHFGLSHFIIKEQVEYLTLFVTTLLYVNFPDRVELSLVEESKSTDMLVDKLKLFISELALGEFNLSLFNSVMVDAEMSWQQLYKMYVGKNVLNQFRQKNGYKTGDYIKIWDNQEDNEFLADVLNDLTDETNIRSIIYSQLEDAYKTVLAANFAQESIS